MHLVQIDDRAPLHDDREILADMHEQDEKARAFIALCDRIEEVDNRVTEMLLGKGNLSLFDLLAVKGELIFLRSQAQTMQRFF